MDGLRDAARVLPSRVVGPWPPDGGGGLDSLGMQQPAVACGFSAPPAQSLLEPVHFHDWDPPCEDMDHLNGAVQGGDTLELQCLQAPYRPEDEGEGEEDGPEMEEFSRLLIALSGQRGSPAASHCSVAAEAEGSGCSAAAAARGAEAAGRCPGAAAAASTPPVHVPTPPGLSMPPAAAAACLGQAARASALPPAVIVAIAGRPVQPAPHTGCERQGTHMSSGMDGTFGVTGHGSAYCSGGRVGRNSSFAQAVGVHTAPLLAHSSTQLMSVLSSVLQLPEDLEKEERHMTQTSEAGEARLRMETSGRPFDILAQPCSSGGGGAAVAPPLQLSDAGTDRRRSCHTHHLAASSEQLLEVQQVEQQQVEQHSSRQPAPLPQELQGSAAVSLQVQPPACCNAAVGNRSASSGQPARKAAKGRSGSSIEEAEAPASQAPASKAPAREGSKPAVKRKHQASDWTLEFLEAEGCLDMDQMSAARHLGYIAPTMLKKQMPRLGMACWPYRLRSTCRNMVTNAEKYIEAKVALHCGPEVQAKAAALIAYLRDLEAKVRADPWGRHKSGLSREEENTRQKLYKLRDEAEVLEASGKWASRLQKDVQGACQLLGIGSPLAA